MMTLEDNITQMVLEHTDTQFNQTSAEMGMKPTITVSEKTIQIQLRAGFPCDLLTTSFKNQLHSSLQEAYPSHSINLSLESCIRAHATQLPGLSLRGVKNVIAVGSGKGGVGKSTVAVNLAVALALAGARVGILDADIYGPSVPMMLGQAEPVRIEQEYYIPVEKWGVKSMSMGYLSDNNQALIWRGPMLAKSLIHLLDRTQWGELDYLFIDLPPGTGDIQLSLVQKIPIAAAVIVTTPQSVATLDAQKAIRMFEKTNVHALGIIENMSQHQCTACGHHDPIFGSGGAEKLALEVGCALLGQLPLDARIGYGCDTGSPTAASDLETLSRPFMQSAVAIAIALSKRPLNYANAFPPIVVA